MISITAHQLIAAPSSSVARQQRFRRRDLGNARSRPCCSSSSSSVIQGIVDAVKSGARSAEDVTTEYLQRIEDDDARLGCFLHVNADNALKQARHVDETRAKQGESALGLLAGVPIAIKDNICTKDEVGKR